MSKVRTGAAGICIVLTWSTNQALATPWVEVGDAQARSDIEVLAAAGLVNDVTMQWPLPWASIMQRLDQIDATSISEPDYVQAAIARLEDEARAAIDTGHAHYGVDSDFTNKPDVVRGFDALGREDVQGQATFELNGESTAVKLAAGAQTLDRYDHQTLVLDGSYIAQRIGNVAVYAGLVTHWWGPGWDTALSLSNNARPFPQIGYRRVTTKAFSTPWLSWLGPWNHEMFLGVFNDPRLARNTLFHATRFEFNPLEGFSFALAKFTEFCGTGQVCQPFEELTNVRNGNAHSSKSKDEVDLDLKYTNTFQGLTYELYNQEMNRDTGPFVHSDTSHLFGASVWVPVRRTAIRFTAEYADTISTENIFSFNKDFYGITYNDYKYLDGWEYRGRTLGSSLDTDSRLASLHANWAGPGGWTYTLTYDRAWIGSPLTNSNASLVTASGYGNRVSTTPVAIDVGEARVHFPFMHFSIDLVGRYQDDQPRPNRGGVAAGELHLVYKL